MGEWRIGVLLGGRRRAFREGGEAGRGGCMLCLLLLIMNAYWYSTIACIQNTNGATAAHNGTFRERFEIDLRFSM